MSLIRKKEGVVNVFSPAYRSRLSRQDRKHSARRGRHAIMEAVEARCLLAAALAPDHIVVVIEQDRAANAIGDTVNMPYFNQLASTGLVYTNAHGVGHPSEPNTLAIYSGSTQGISDNGNLHTFTAPNLAESLNSKLVGVNQYLSFAGYVENLPQDGDTTTPIAGDPNNPAAPPDLYERNVNAMAQFTNVGQRGAVALTNAQVNMTFASFPTTAAGYASLPTVSYVIPNGLHNTHGSNEQAPYATDPYEYDFLRSSADTWLANNLDSYLQWAKANNSLLIVISDEEETDTHPSTTITMIVNGDQDLFVAGQNSNYVSHYDLVRTITDMYGLSPLGDTAAVSGLATDDQGRLATTATALGATTTSLISSSTTSLLGQGVTFTATVTANAGGATIPTGTVTFRDGATVLGTAALDASGKATFTTSTLSPGPHSVIAAYGGDSAMATSASTAVAQTVALANDNFASRTLITGATVTATGSTRYATREAGEPDHGNALGDKSVWWTWTAPVSGTVTIDTIGSSFDTTLGVYTGTSVSALTLVKGDDDSAGGNASEVTFAATAGTVYQIAVDGAAGVFGNVVLNVSAAGVVPTPGNLALGKPATSSSQESAAMGAASAVDGNSSTRWASGDWDHMGSPKWLMVDLGTVQAISGVNITWEWAAAKEYQVQVSNDGAAWTTISNQTNGTDGLKSITGLSASGRYVRIYCTAGATAWGYSIYELQVMGAGVQPPPTQGIQAPTGVSASTGSYTDRVRVTWTAATNAAGYEVWRSTANNSAAATKISAADVTGTSFDDTTATTGTTYWYWVKAKSSSDTSGFSGGSSGYASAVVTTPGNLALGKPATSSSQESGAMSAASAVDGNTSTRWASGDWDNMGSPKWLMVDLGAVQAISAVNIRWEWAAAKEYQVQVSNDGANWTTVSNQTNGTDGLKSITGLSASGRYVRVYCTAGATAWGYSIYELQVMGAGAPTQGVQAPTGVSASDGSYTDRVRITWTAATNAAGYEVWRSTANNSAAATKISAADVTGTSFDDTTAAVGTTYWYWVKAKNSGGTSGFSSGNSGHASAVVTTPTNLALGKTATSSSQESAALSAANAVDGSGSTRWASGDWDNMSSPKWLRIDLGAVRTISSVNITWEWAAAKEYQVQVSNDGAAWTTVSSQTNGTDGLKSITGLNTAGRYVRIYCTLGATAWGYSIYELQVMGV